MSNPTPHNSGTTITRECLVVSRTLAADPAKIFAVLTDPDRHQDTEPGDWVRAAVDANPITAMGQVFAVNMFLDAAGGGATTWRRRTKALP
ncbi:Polyketide cyclase/dehydrase [Rhodococcus sp. AW25M09]|nr:Polyketide cyclase/dehydrase [Rhodococcus sp. AW25M09]